MGYAGGVLAFAAGFIAVEQLWPGISTRTELAFAAAATVVLLAAGAVVGAGRDPALARLRSALWLLSTGCLAAAVALLTTELSLSAVRTTLVVSAATGAYAGVLWLRLPAPLQHLAVFAALAVAAGSGAAGIGQDATPWSAGLGVWVLSALWAAAAHRGYLPPPTAGYLASAVGLLAGAQMTMDTAAGQALALVTVAALLAAGVALQRVWLLGVGAFGVVQVVPQTATRYLPESVGAPLALFVVGRCSSWAWSCSPPRSGWRGGRRPRDGASWRRRPGPVVVEDRPGTHRVPPGGAPGGRGIDRGGAGGAAGPVGRHAPQRAHVLKSVGVGECVTPPAECLQIPHRGRAEASRERGPA